jgi:integrase
MDGGTSRKTGNRKLTPREIDTWLARYRDGKLRPSDPRLKLSDGDGMYVTVTPAGTPVFRIKYRQSGKEKTYAITPGSSLDEARKEREKVRGWLREGHDPVQARDLERASNVEASDQTFRAVYEQWLKKQEKQWSAIHYTKSRQALERDVLGKLGHLPVRAITPAMVARVVEAKAQRGAIETASKLRQHIGGIFRLAQARGLCDYKENPADAAREVLPKRAKRQPRPALLTWPELGDVLRAAEKVTLSPAVRLAHRLCAFTATRISNVVEAEWREFHLDGDPPVWIIPRAKMKAQDRAHDHKVILGATIAAELRIWRDLMGRKGYVFPSPAGGDHITRESIEKLYRKTLGLEGRHSPHSWRSAFSTLARDKGDEHDKKGNVVSKGFERDVVELALDHVHDNEVVRVYDRGERLAERIRLMQWWDAELSRVQRGADVVQLKLEEQRV